MESRLQHRIQRYGWDLAARGYEALWSAQLLDARETLLSMVPARAGEHVLDVACGTGLLAFAFAHRVGAAGSVLGVDISQRMVESCEARARRLDVANATFLRSNAERLDLPDARFDLALCALGLMYMPDPLTAVREMRRLTRPGGRVGLAVWGERRRCGWAEIFPIVDTEVRSEVCPMFFALGPPGALERLCAEAGLESIHARRVSATLHYADADDACDAGFLGGPVALAWSRFDQETRARARRQYLASLEPYRSAGGYEVPGEFVVVSARCPSGE